MSDLAVAFYKTVKHNSHCLICSGVRDLQFHHVCPSEKITEIHKIAKNAELIKVIEELNKCVPLCDTDHRAVHRGNRNGWLKGQFDNGKQSQALEAFAFLPYLPWFFKQKPHVLIRFYKDTLERDVTAIKELSSAVGLPRLGLERIK